MFGLSLGRLGTGQGSGSALTINVTSSGGDVRDGTSFTVYYAAGGLTGATSVTIDGVACTSITVVDDYNLTAIAPADNLAHGSAYTMVIS